MLGALRPARRADLSCRAPVGGAHDQGHSKYERGLILNHEEAGVTADYSHGYPVELKRELLEKWADHVAQKVQPEGSVLLS